MPAFSIVSRPGQSRHAVLSLGRLHPKQSVWHGLHFPEEGTVFVGQVHVYMPAYVPGVMLGLAVESQARQAVGSFCATHIPPRHSGLQPTLYTHMPDAESKLVPNLQSHATGAVVPVFARFAIEAEQSSHTVFRLGILHPRQKEWHGLHVPDEYMLFAGQQAR